MLLKEDIKNSELLLDDYDIFRRDRPGKCKANDKEGTHGLGGFS